MAACVSGDLALPSKRPLPWSSLHRLLFVRRLPRLNTPVLFSFPVNFRALVHLRNLFRSLNRNPPKLRPYLFPPVPSLSQLYPFTGLVARQRAGPLTPKRQSFHIACLRTPIYHLVLQNVSKLSLIFTLANRPRAKSASPILLAALSHSVSPFSVPPYFFSKISSLIPFLGSTLQLTHQSFSQ